MGFILKSVTPGDSLIPSKKTDIMFSKDKTLLEGIMFERARERKKWIEDNDSIPDWAKAGIAYKDVIEEVEVI